MKDYDKEGCYCLLIAIMTGLDAREARILYRKGPSHPACHEIVRKRKWYMAGTPKDKMERKKAMKQMKEEGCSVETIAAIFHCDASTVKRNLKKLE